MSEKKPYQCCLMVKETDLINDICELCQSQIDKTTIACRLIKEQISVMPSMATSSDRMEILKIMALRDIRNSIDRLEQTLQNVKS